MPTLLELTFEGGEHAAPRRVQISGAVIGRSAEVEIPIQDTSASRRHAVLHRVGDDFEIENASPNGTRVNGKKIDKRLLKDGDIIEIGAAARLRVRYLTQSGAVIGHEAADTDPVGAFDESNLATANPSSPRKPSLLRKPKVIIGLTCYFLGLLAFMLMLETRSPRSSMPPGKSREEIAAMMQHYFAADNPAFEQTPDAKKEAAALDRAREAFNTAPVSTDSLWRAAYGFRMAQAYSSTHAWRQVDDARRFREAVDRLSNRLADEYIDALAEQRKGRLKEARKLFYRLQQMVPDRKCELNQHIGRWLSAINANLD